MDTDTWLSSFRLRILNTEMNCFDGLFQFGPLGEISYPNQLLLKLLWPNLHSNDSIPKPTLEPIESFQMIKWMSEYPSYWNELRILVHCGIKSILITQQCPKVVIETLKNDGEKITCAKFKMFWMEIYKALTYIPKTSEVDFKLQAKKNQTVNVSNTQSMKLTRQKASKTNANSNIIESKQKQKIQNPAQINDAKSQCNQETSYLHSQNQEIQWKIQAIKDTSAKFRKNFNKLNFAYLFLRNYNIFNLSELIRKNLKIECSRPTKFNYYNILRNDRIYQENRKLVKGIIRQYKYKRRTRAMSADDDPNTIWTLNKITKPKNIDELENDKINITCALKTAILNNNLKEILRLSIDKRIKLINAIELERMGYFRAIQSNKIKEENENTKQSKSEEEDIKQSKRTDEE